MLIKKNIKNRIKNLLSSAFVFSAILGMTTFGVQSAEAVSSSEYISNTANLCLSANVADLTDTGKGIFQSSKVVLKGVMTGGASYATLNEAVAGDADREYTLPADGETISAPLGTMGGADSTLTINGASESNGINGNSNTGITVGSGQTLILNSIANISGFTTPFISNNANGTVTVNNSVFTNNKSSTNYVDIYNEGTLNINAAGGKTVTFNGAVTGENGILVINNDPTVKGGTYVFNGDIDGQIMRIYNGAVIKLGSYQQEDGSTTYGVLKLAGFEPTGETVTLDLRNNHIDTHHFGDVRQGASVNHLIDVDLTGKKTDRFTADKTTAVSGNILIGAINLISGSGDSEMIVNLSRNSFRFAMALTPDIMSHISWAEGVTYNVNTLDYDYISGNLIFNAADFIPNGGTLDKVYKTSSNYLAKGIGQHAVYSSSDLSTVKDDDHPYVVVIGGTLYYFKPHESTDELNNAIIDLAATGALADKVVLSTDNYIFEKDGKYYTYSKALLPKSVWEDSEANSSSYNYYESVGTTNNYYNVVFRTNFMNAIDTTTWELSDSATAGGYSWWGKNYTPFASEIKPVEDGSGNLISASGMVRLGMQKNDTQTETRYYRYNYTVPADYEKASSRIVLSDDYITNKYFYGLSNSSNGGAVYNNTNHGHNINADFINNSTTGNGGAIYNDSTNGKLGYISGTFINNRGYEGGVLFNNRGTIKAILGDFIGNIASKSGGLVRNYYGTIGLIQGRFIGNRAGETEGGWGGVISNKVEKNDTHIEKAYIEIILGDFIANRASKGGGAIDMNGKLGTVIGDFIANKSIDDGGGAIRIEGGFIGNITGDFISNTSNKGGAMHLQGNDSKIGVIYGDFITNSATSGTGGAINLGTSSSVLEGVYGNFTGNTSTDKGGAVYNAGRIDRLSANFTANHSNNTSGGAIYNASGAYIGLRADDFGDILFRNNTAGTGTGITYNDIYNAGTIDFIADTYVEDEVTKQHTITLDGTVTGSNGTININKDSVAKGGKYIFNNTVSGNKINLYNGADVKLGSVEQADATTTVGRFDSVSFTNDANGGTLNTQNYSISTNSLGSVTLNSDLNYIFEMNLDSATPESDKITANYSSGTGKIALSEINLLGTKSWADFTSADVGKSVKILNSNNNALQLALSSGLATIFEDNKVLFSSSQKSKTPAAIGADTQWVNDAYKYTIVDEKIYGKWDLKTTSTTNDSLGFIQQAPIDEVRYESMGDALKLVNNDTTNATKNFTAQTDGMTYTVGDNLGATKGTLNVNGIAGGDAETIDLKDFTGFEVGTDATALNFNNVTVESSTALNPTLITVSNGSASIGVSNAVLNGAITRTGDVTYDINATDTNVLQNVTGAKIANSGDLTLSGTNNLVNITNASGSTEITGGTTTSGAITQDSLTITGGKLVATNGVTTTNGVTNSIAHGLEVQNGIINSDITGTGSTDISTGNVSLTDGKTISQQINLLSGTFTTNADGIGTGLDVTSGTVELTGGTLAKDITGAGTTKIKTGDVIVTDGSIANNVSIESGSLTSSIEKLGGTIANEGTLNATGTLAKAITGAGTTKVNGTLTLNNGAEVEGTLNLNGGAVTVSNGSITIHDIGTLTGTGSFAIDINSGAGTIDSLNVANASSGTVNITSLNDLGTKPTSEGTYTYNVITGTGSGVTLTLADSIKTSTEWYQAESTSHGEHTADTIQATTNWDDTYYDRWTDTTTGKSIAVSGNAIVYTVINHTSDESAVLGDTLALVNKAEIDGRTFSTTDKTKTYTLSSALGTTAAGALTLSGASDGTNTSTIDLNTQNGFNLTNATTLTLTDVKLTNATGDVVTLNNSDAVLNISANSIADGSVTNTSGTVTNSGSITGAVNNAGTFTNTGTISGNVTNSGTLTSSVDNLGGTIANAGTLNATGTLAKAITGAGTTNVNGTLTLNSGAAIDGTLDLNSGAVTVSNGSITIHDIGTLTGTGSFAIDINSGAGTIDSLNIANASTGTVNITSLNDIGTKPTAEGTYTYNVITGTGSGVTLTLADSIKTSTEWYQAESTSHGEHTADTIQATTNWDDTYYDRWTDTTTGKSIAVSGNAIVYTVINHTSDESAVLGDTLALVNQANIDRTFSTTDKTKTYTLSSALGTTAAGALTLSGASDGTNTSTIDLNTQNGFNLTNATTLTFTDVKLTNATGDAVTLNNSDAALNISANSKVDGSVTNTSGTVTNSGSITGAVNNAGTFTNGGSIGGALTNSSTFTNTGTISGNVTNSGSLTSAADDILGTIANNGTLTITGGTVNNDITGTGTTNITADLTNAQTIDQANISVNPGATVTNSGTINATTALTLDGNVNNNAGSSLTAGSITNNGTVNNSGTMSVGGGVNSGNITGSGSLTNTGNLTNNSVIVQNSVANNGNLLNNGTISADTITNSGTVNNSGVMSVGGGVNSGNITGSGSLMNTGNLTNNSVIVQNSVVNNGNLINSGTISANAITNNAGGTITSNTQNLISSSPIVNSGTLNLTGSATFSDISGDATGKVNINADSSSFVLNNKIQGNELTFNGDVLRFGINGSLADTSQFNFNANAVDLVNNSISNTNFGNLNLLSNMNLMLDGNFAQQTLDTISATGFNSNGNFINISHINILEPTTAQTFSISPIGKDVSDSVRSSLAAAIRYTGGELVYSPIYKYSVAYNPANGMLDFTSLNGGEKYNPAVLVAPGVAQTSGQVTMWQNFNTAFEHADTFMPYPKALRTAQQNANLYALSTDYNDNIDVIAEMGYEHTNLASWVKPYTSFESLRLKNGPKMDMISYGSIFGGDSDFRRLKNGWSNVGTVYIGYNGSQIDYDDVDVTTNGGTLGITESFYKNNFFTAITVAAGGGFAQAHTMYGKEDLTMIMAGIASKTGYNLEFLDGRFIIQPTLQLNYSMVKTFDYTNAAGVRINSDPAHTLQINPNIRFIGNFKGGWQPYASIGMIWNVMNVSHNLANNAELPQMYTKPYVEYGVGLQKQIGEKFSGYGQVMVRNGGRTGVALTAGFRWFIGRNKDNNKTFEKNVSNKTSVKKSESTNKKVKSKKTENVSPEKNEYNLDLIKLDSAESQINTKSENNIASAVKPFVDADKTKNPVKKNINNYHSSRARYEKYFQN